MAYPINTSIETEMSGTIILAILPDKLALRGSMSIPGIDGWLELGHVTYTSFKDPPWARMNFAENRSWDAQSTSHYLSSIFNFI